MSAPTEMPILVDALTSAFLLDVRYQTLRRWTVDGTIPSRLDANCQVVYDVADINAFVKPFADEGVS